MRVFCEIVLICTTFRLNITCSTQEVFSLLKGFNRLKQNRSPLLYQLVANKAYRVTREKKMQNFDVQNFEYGKWP